MFNFSFGELLILAVIGLIVIGPKQLPQVAKIIARTIGEFKRAINDVKDSVTADFKDDVLKTTTKNSIAPEPTSEKDVTEKKEEV